VKTLFMFPGQGAQHVAMGKALAQQSEQVAAIYRQANEIVGYDLTSICFDGPQEKLDTTAVSQPAIFVTSVACLTALRAGQIQPELEGVEPDACAGLSLGEYTALHAAGAMSFADGLRLVQLRGESMQAAAEASDGTMVSVLGLAEDAIKELCDKVLEELEQQGVSEPLLCPVNYNCPGQIVLSGTRPACERAATLAEEFGASRAIPLAVSGAFHSKMMAPAAEKLAQALAQCRFQDPQTPVYANVDATPYEGADQVSEKLLKQLTQPVRWQQTIDRLFDEGFERFVEIGPGRVLTGLVKKTGRARKLRPQIVTVNA